MPDALPPMDPEFEQLARAYKWTDGGANSLQILAALWSWVVAYGDRRAEEAKKDVRTLVHAAYREGIVDGAPEQSPADHAHALKVCWPKSSTRAALNALVPTEET